MHTETWNCFPLSLIGDKRPPPFAALVCVRLSVRLVPSRPALSASICSLHRSSNNSPAQVNPSCALHNCKLGRKILRRRRLVVIRCCEQPPSCTQPTCTAGWLSPRPVCFGPTSAQQHCIAASHRIASSPSVYLLVCLSADLPNNSLPPGGSCFLQPLSRFRDQSETCTQLSFRSASQSVNQPPFSESRSSGRPLTVSAQAIKTSRAGRTAISARPGPKPSPPSSFLFPS